MLGAILDLARPLLAVFDSEKAHELTLRALEAGLYPRTATSDHPCLHTTAWGLHFSNPIGIAAGFDKDARVIDAVLDMGFGYSEIGTITPRAQEGNPRPRVFRLAGDHALINRLGFNNAGHGPARARLMRRRSDGVVGVNVGANKNSLDRTADYVEGVRAFYDLASYFAINISSPNTPGLRDLQAPAALDELLSRVLELRAQLVQSGKPKRPIVVKLAPDLVEEEIEPIVRVLRDRGVDGISISNTTLARTGLSPTALATEPGGISGRPLFHRSTALLARIYQLTEGAIPLIGVGGIDSGATAIAKIEAGAALLQLYTGLIYGGLPLLARIKRELVAYVASEKLTSIASAVGRRATDWATKPLEI